MARSGWIGIDLDGTLAHYDGWKGTHHIGEPVPTMLRRVKAWIEMGETVKIFTARVCYAKGDDLAAIATPIWEWCERHGLPKLDITCVKDFSMIALYDDRCYQVEMNTGRIIGEDVKEEAKMFSGS